GIIRQPHDTERADATGAMRRHDRDSLRDEREFSGGVLCDHRRRRVRRARRPHRAPVEIDLALWRRARQPSRFRQLRGGPGVGLLAAYFSTAPWPTLTFVGLVSVASIPLTVRAYHRRRRAIEARKSEPAAETASAPIPTPPPGPIGDTAPANQWRH